MIIIEKIDEKDITLTAKLVLSKLIRTTIKEKEIIIQIRESKKNKKTKNNQNEEQSKEKDNDHKKKKNDKRKERDEEIQEAKNEVKHIRVLKYYDELLLNYRDILDNKIEDVAKMIKSIQPMMKQMIQLNGVFDLESNQDIINQISYIYKIFPDVLIVIAKTLASTLEKELPISIKNLCNDENLWNPKRPTAKDFNYSKAVGFCRNPKYRYYMNDSLIKARDDYYAKLNKKDNDEEDDAIARRINYKMFTDLGSQARFKSPLDHVFAAILWYDSNDPWDCLDNLGDRAKRWLGYKKSQYRSGFDLLSIKTILYILSKFDIMPFYTTDLNRITTYKYIEKDMPLSLPWLISSLCELSIQEKGLNIGGKFLERAIAIRLKAAQTSFGSEMLAIKSKYTDTIKLYLSKITDYSVYQYTDDTCVTCAKRMKNNSKEIFLENEETIMEDSIKVHDMDYHRIMIEFIKQAISKDSLDRNTEIMRYMLIVAGIMGNAGIFYKTSLALEFEASIAAHTKTVIDPPQPVEYIEEEGMLIPIKYDWEVGAPIFKDINRVLRQAMDDIKGRFESRNFEEWFVDLLTNNSNGIRASLDDLMISQDIIDQNKLIPRGEKDVRIELFSRLSNARLIAFVLDHKSFSVFTDWVNQLMMDGVATIRFQNNRRARIVEIVPNVEQIAYSPILRAFELFKMQRGQSPGQIDWSSISVGKQVGGVADMSIQVSRTGNGDISMCSDITGMDAHTQPMIYKTFGLIMVDWMREQGFKDMKYFSLGPKDYEILDNNLKINKIEQLGGLVRTMLIVAATKNLGKTFKLRDGYFTDIVNVTTGFFASGQLNTTAQHTILLSIIAGKLKEEMDYKFGGKVSFNMNSLIFGDDQMIQISTNSNDEIVQSLTEGATKIHASILKQVGYEMEIQVSRRYADFLQQTAVCGIVAPKSARSAIYCDERSNAYNRDPIALIKIMVSVIKAASQRHYNIGGVMDCIIGIWMLLRAMNLKIKKSAIKNKKYVEVRENAAGRLICLIPYEVIYMPPINLHCPFTIYSSESKVFFMRRHYASVSGDYGWIWLVNSMLDQNDWDKLKRIYYETDKGNEVDDIALKIAGSTYSIPIAKYLYKYKRDILHKIIGDLDWLDFSRENMLSGSRMDAVEPDLLKLSSRVDSHKNIDRINRSRHSAYMLETTYKINVPDDLRYSMQSMRKLKQAIATVNEMANELPLVDNKILDFINNIGKIYKKKYKDMFNMYGFHIRFTDDLGTIEIIKQQYDYKLPLMPGYHAKSGYGYLATAFGGGFDRLRNTTKPSEFSNTSKKSNKFDLEKAAKLIIKARKMYGEDAVKLLKDTYGLSLEEEQELDEVVDMGGVLTGIYEYSSQYSPSMYFGISRGTPIEILSWMKMENAMVKINKYRDLMSLVLRDHYYAHADTHGFKKVLVGVANFTETYYLQALSQRIYNQSVLVKVRM